jgi:hypothetical protein
MAKTRHLRFSQPKTAKSPASPKAEAIPPQVPPNSGQGEFTRAGVREHLEASQWKKEKKKRRSHERAGEQKRSGPENPARSLNSGSVVAHIRGS